MILGFAVSAGTIRPGPDSAVPPPPPPPPLAAPGLSGTLAFAVDPVTRAATTTYSADIPARHFWAITPTGVEPPAQDIATGTGALAFGYTDYPAGSIAAAWTLPANLVAAGAVVSVVARQLPDGPWSNVLRASGVDVDTRIGAVFTETFGGFAVGDTSAQILAAGWARSNTTINADIQADADGPAGRRMLIRTTSSSIHRFNRQDISDVLALGSFAAVEILLRLRGGSVSGARGGFGWRQSDTAITGLGIRRGSTGTNLEIGENFSPNNAGPVSLGFYSGDALVWVRLLYDDGIRLRGKAWTGALGDEPAAWSDPVTWSGAGTWATNLRNVSAISRTSSVECALILGFSVGIDRAAPNFYP